MNNRGERRIPPRSRRSQTAAEIEQELREALRRREDARRAYRKAPLTWPLGDIAAERAHETARRRVASWERAIRDLSLRLEMARKREQHG
jgi:hypothetical protein